MSITNLKNKHFSSNEKLRILNLLTEKRTVRNICKENNISEGSFYAWKSKYEANGLEGLKRKKGDRSNHPQNTNPENVSIILEFSIANPEMGCCSIAAELKSKGRNVSSPSVQKHLLRARLGKRSQRIYELEKRHLTKGLKITAKQKALINKYNPYFKYLNLIGTYPGEVLVQDTFQIFSYLPETYIYVVIDTYSCYVFAQPRKVKSPAIAVDFISSTALDFFKGHDFKVTKVITGKGKEFACNKKEYTKYLHALNINHETYSVIGQRHHGYIDKFKDDLSLQLRSIKLDLTDLNTLCDYVSRICIELNENHNLVQWFPTCGNSPTTIVKRHAHQK